MGRSYTALMLKETLKLVRQINALANDRNRDNSQAIARKRKELDQMLDRLVSGSEGV